MPESSALADAVAATDPSTRLAHLVAAWRLKRSPDLAEAIISLGTSLDRARPTIAGRTVDARLKTWLELERTRDDALTGYLLASPPLQGTLTAHYEPRIKRIARWKPDPRIVPAMLALVEDFTFVAHAELWNPVFAQLATSADNTIIPRLRELLTATSDTFFTSRFTKLINTLSKIKPAKLTAAEKRLLAQLREPSTDGEADLLAAIYASPDDDAPRLVYADYLQQRDDPRGEFIALQLSKSLDVDGRKRLRALYAKHKLRWFGPLEPAILEQRSFAFARGFLVSACVCAKWGAGPNDVSEPRERAILALQDHPAWATLRTVKLTPLAERTRVPLLAHLKRLGVTVEWIR